MVLAPNAFKGSVSAAQAADAMATGLLSARPDALVTSLPVADGGDGSLDAFVRAGYRAHAVTTRGPTGAPVASAFAERDGTALVELATACGMARLPGGRPDPLESSTLGLGDAMRAALSTNPERLVVCLGGSASTDGGSGMLVGLGARLIDPTGHEVAPSGHSLTDVVQIDLSGLDPRLASVELVAAVDVTSPLTGPRGAAAVFAPQKGADAAQVAQLDAGLRHWAGILHRTWSRQLDDVAGAGAAGGTAAALIALGARLEPGADLLARTIGLDAALVGADLVITGEGRLDAQSALGKGSLDVVRRARESDTPVIMVCGVIDLPDEELRSIGLAGWADLVSRTDSAEAAIGDAPMLITAATADAVRSWSAG